MTPAEELQRSERAKQILADPLVRSAIEDIRATVIEQWRITPVKDKELRDQMWGIYNALFKFEELLQMHIENGKVAASNLAYVEKEQSVWERFKQKL